MATEANQSVGNDRVRRPRHAPARSIVARRARRGLGLLSLALLLVAALTSSAQAASVGLGTAGSFSVLGGSTVTNTGPSVLNGDLGLSPGTAITGFPSGTVHGTIHANDAVAQQAQADLTTAYNDAAGRSSTATVTGDLAGRTLSRGVYTSASSLGLSGDLTLDAQGDPNAVFIFQAGSTLTTGAGSRVLLTGGAQACNVFWQVGSSATIGTSTAFTGNILALTSISVNDGVTVNGRALARNGAVTLNNDTITAANCATGGGTTGGGGTGGTGGGPTGGGGTGGTGGGPTGGGGTGGTAGGPTVGGPIGPRNGIALITTLPRSVAKTVAQFGTSRCVHGTFRVVVRGRFIRRVVFSLDGRIIATRGKSPFEALVRTRGGIHRLTARVTFSGGTRAATLRLRFRSCAAAKRRVVIPRFTG